MQGALWSRETADLDVNVVAFPAGSGVAEHVNDEVDVLVVVIAGQGQAEISGRDHPLSAGVALVIPKGAPRSIHCTAGRLIYLTCHRRRARLTPSRALHT
jgi:quercetin dioxygenase-like cupin family protein